MAPYCKVWVSGGPPGENVKMVESVAAISQKYGLQNGLPVGLPANIFLFSMFAKEFILIMMKSDEVQLVQ